MVKRRNGHNKSGRQMISAIELAEKTGAEDQEQVEAKGEQLDVERLHSVRKGTCFPTCEYEEPELSPCILCNKNCWEEFSLGECCSQSCLEDDPCAKCSIDCILFAPYRDCCPSGCKTKTDLSLAEKTAAEQERAEEQI